MKLFATIGDLMLSKVLPHESASAACPTRSWYQYKCVQGRRRLRRRCTDTPQCTTTCTAWTYYSMC
ncbi:hypothetical protein LX16_1638 [Stackebrandtia albiflava]|uniref:Uncharacterized protein n=1 Tax=Stackebrandtia albiflava TaxID=406432 RepID=A0A562VDF9_9ACTN|nr:hypothetical protein [Stackebrandtia albiflava]TWJ15919.1 hypothetical protein LX16_1638 [Stackebrandtia albiflava]